MLCILNKFIKKHLPTEAEQTPITCFSACNIEYNLNRLFEPEQKERIKQSVNTKTQPMMIRKNREQRKYIKKKLRVKCSTGQNHIA